MRTCMYAVEHAPGSGEHREHENAKYQLREQALAWAGSANSSGLSDCDQGLFRGLDKGRDGFQQLVAEVSLG